MSTAVNPVHILDGDLLARSSQIKHDFHRLSYEEGSKGLFWEGCKYFGVKLWKIPSDLQLYQETIYDIKPALIIETGTAWGGSALYFAHLMDQLSHGGVVTIDIEPWLPTLPRHSRIDYWMGMSSTDPHRAHEAKLRAQAAGGEVMVVLDSLHTKKHVLAELQLYAYLVTPGSYLVVEDTDVGPNDVVYPEHGPGPGDALREWLPQHPDFRVDEGKAEKYGFSFHTWLRRRRG